MIKLRAAKVAGIANELSPLEVDDPDSAKVLIIGWGSTYGAITGAVRRIRARKGAVAYVHLTHMNPLPSDLGTIISRYENIIVPELNTGQLSKVLRAQYSIKTIDVNKIQAQPFKVAELEEAIEQVVFSD
jgi:2-oxoglutarate ferredoxin oxidoreductase subunit alpha